MYSLLNYIAASSKSSEGAKMIGSSPYLNDGDVVTNNYVETGLRSFTDEEKRLVSISTVCVVSTLALEFKIEEACAIAEDFQVYSQYPLGYSFDDINAPPIPSFCRSFC
jgi:hypothetical protein